MNSFTYLHMEKVYEAERKALSKAACDGLTPAYMQGICAMVAQLESDILDEEAEKAAKEAAKNDTDAD